MFEEIEVKKPRPNVRKIISISVGDMPKEWWRKYVLNFKNRFSEQQQREFIFVMKHGSEEGDIEIIDID